MKPRIKIDVTLLTGVIVLTFIICFFPQVYPRDILTDDLLDAIGLILILKGTLLRMAARGHKKAFSQKSEELVTTGIYSVVRNPMYLGSFTLGAGFVLTAWPWWALIPFAILFYMRFNLQMTKEEEFLKQNFGQRYIDYANRVPRIFPKIERVWNIKLSNVVDLSEMLSTKEKRGLLTWPLLAVVLEAGQEYMVYHHIDLVKNIYIAVITAVIFIGGTFLSYKWVR